MSPECAVSFRVIARHAGELADRIARLKTEINTVPTNAYIYARKARANGHWDVAFSYRMTKPPARDDYYYLRVVQIDGEAAWVSPHLDRRR